MIISPPFLPAKNDLPEDAWIDAAMPLDLPNGGAPRGIFPVGQNLGWHGGAHLVAPMDGQTALPVRAISDGTVIYVRQTSSISPDPTKPLNYNPALLGASRTDDGCVVIRHETEIGATAAGAATTLTFFSIYMNLATVTCATQTVAGVPQPRSTPFSIYRKDEIGTAGQIYGQPNRIHFEIIFDDAALQSILGRPLTEPAPGADGTPTHTLDLASDSNGRANAVFGEIYFRLPVGTSVYPAPPAANVTAPVAVPTDTLTGELIVGMKFAAGDGPSAHRGDISYRTYQLDGAEIGTAIIEPEGEYNLYTSATHISTAYPASGRPAPSAVYELLRFGRIIDTDNETLTPADVPMWKDVNFTGGHGWVNLHATGVHVYSDADLPQWKGWQVVDSDTDSDSRCDAARIRAILDEDGDGTITPKEATTRIGDADVRKKLSRFICKMPTEWEEANIDTRWGWLKTKSTENPIPFDDTRDFQPFKAHVAALCFWQPANLGIPATHWHAHPIEFIRHFRKCGWLSTGDLARCIPRRIGDDTINWATANSRAATHHLPMSQMFRKYNASSPIRQIHLLAQILTETVFLHTVVEGGSGYGHPYGAFFGRGYLQLTWLTNYKNYGVYRAFPNHTGAYEDSRITATSTHQKEDPGSKPPPPGSPPGTPSIPNLPVKEIWSPKYDPDIVSSILFNASDSGGFYWVTKHFRGTSNLWKIADGGFEPRFVAFANWAVNGGGNGYAERHRDARYLFGVLGDELPLTGDENWHYPVLSRLITGTVPPGNPQNNQVIHVHHDKQTP